MIAGQEFARTFVEEAPHGAMKMGLIMKARLVRDLGQRRGVVEIEQAHDPVDLQNLPKELGIDPDDLSESPIECALIGVQSLANICDTNSAVRGLEHRYCLLDDRIAGTGALRKGEKERICLFDMLVASTGGAKAEMLARQRFDLRPDVADSRSFASDAFTGNIEQPMQGRGGQLAVDHLMPLRVMHGDVVIDNLACEMPT